MRRLMTHVTRTVAVLAIAGAPTIAIAQTPQTSQTNTSAAQPNPAAEHLAAARASLNKVLNAPAPSGDAFKKLSDIKTNYLALEKAASTAAPEWKTHYKEIDRLAGELLDAPSAPDTPVGTSGRADAPPMKGLDPAIETNLRQFRTHLTAFAASMPAPGTAAAAAPAATSATAATAATSTPPPAATPPPATAATTSSTAATATKATTPAAAEASSTSVASQVDQAIALVDATLNANAQATSISVDRATLEQLKVQLEQIKQGVKKQ